MAKAVFLFPFLLLLVSENLLFAKETSLKHSDKGNPNKKLLHEEKHKTILSNKAHFPQNRNNLRKCQIICPFVLPPPENCNNGPNHPVKPTVKPTTSSPPKTPPTTEESSTESEESTEDVDTDTETDAPPSNSTGQSKNITSKFHKAMKHGPTQTFRIVAFHEKKHKLDHGHRRNTYHRLSNRQKRILLKQLNLENRHGRKGYRFRQFDLYQCQVKCEIVYEDEYPNIAQPITFNEEEGDLDGDNYEEGEDTPIEITSRPIIPQNTVLAGVRPFGNVDFIGMDDFGPSGELAGDPSVIYEEKNNRKKTEKAKPRKKATVAEKRI